MSVTQDYKTVGYFGGGRNVMGLTFFDIPDEQIVEQCRVWANGNAVSVTIQDRKGTRTIYAERKEGGPVGKAVCLSQKEINAMVHGLALCIEECEKRRLLAPVNMPGLVEAHWDREVFLRELSERMATA